VGRSRADAGRLAAEHGWAPRVELADGVARMVRWAKGEA
jgi:nucleoside-diphosphate-sugar epimerase